MSIFISQRPGSGLHPKRPLQAIIFIGILAHGLSACTKQSQQLAQPGDFFPLSVLSEDILLQGTYSDLSNKTLLINFWATWCTPCRKEMPDLQTLNEQLDADSFRVIGVSIDEDINLAKEFLLQYNIRFTHFQDKDQHIATARLGIKAYPESFIVSPAGKIIKRVTGEQKWNKAFFQQLLSTSRNTQGPAPLRQVAG